VAGSCEHDNEALCSKEKKHKNYLTCYKAIS
jgi:hypothetical protein